MSPSRHCLCVRKCISTKTKEDKTGAQVSAFPCLAKRRDMGHPIYPPAHTQRSSNCWSDFHYKDVRIIDPHRTCLSGQIPSKTAPAPLLRRRYQPALNRVAMDIAKLFDPLALRENIEIIKPRLPESVSMNWGAPGLADFARPGSRPHDALTRTLHTLSLIHI